MNWYKFSKKWKENLSGGNADGKTPKDYESSQIEKGHAIEFEHTDNPDIAKEITMDHLEEHKDYYTGLKHMENMLKEIEQREKKNKKSSQQSMIKTAKLDYKNQDKVFEDDFGDLERYVFDAYNIRIYLNKTDSKISVSLIVNHYYIGTVVLNLFWFFDLDKMKEAKKMYKEVVKINKDLMTKFVEEEIPTCLFSSYLKRAVHEIEGRNVNRTNNPIINYSYDIPYEDDWRKTIYGPRYPKHKEESFNQYLNNSIYSKKNPPSGKFAL